jgi:hypothetical protein
MLSYWQSMTNRDLLFVTLTGHANQHLLQLDRPTQLDFLLPLQNILV